jgi:hypothetical protein
MMPMTYEEIMQMAAKTQLPFAYDHFAEGESPDPPFLVFLFPRSDNFSADGKVYTKANVLHFELYTDEKRPDIERQVEAVLDRHGIFYDKTEVWIAEEGLYEVLYEMEVIQNE